MTPQTRNRVMLVALFVLFFGGAFVAGTLRFIGWQPDGHKNHGEMLQPAVDLRALTLQRVDGGAYAWEPMQRRWRIMLLAPAACDVDCAGLIADLDKVWRLLGRHADSVDVLWLGVAPATPALPAEFVPVQVDPAVLAALPHARDAVGVPVYVVDPNGFVVLRYAPGFDIAGLRADLAQLLKLK